ncbi:MAG: hypothetical protein V4773_01825 [Verrucomicrobiota bacterium]
MLKHSTLYAFSLPAFTMIPVVIVLLLLTALVATEPSSPGGNEEN